MNALQPGDPVVVIAGLSKGIRGIVRDIAKFRWSATVPHFAVEFPHPEGVRVIRADYLVRLP